MNRLLSLSVLLILTASGIILCSWTCDDAYISFRYSRNLASGLGLTFNPLLQDPVEGFSNTLWVLLAAIPALFDWQIVPFMNWLSLGCGLLLTFRVFKVLEEQLEYSPFQAALLAATASLSPPFLVWGTSGLATMPFALLLFLVFESCFVKKSATISLTDILALAGLTLIRAEGFLWIVVLLSFSLFLNPARRTALLKLAGVFAIILCAQFSLRYFYYGQLMPNTASAKVGFSLARLLRGADYVIVYLLTFLSPLFAFFAALRFKYLWQHKTQLMAFLLFLGVLAYSVLVGGDYMSMGRFLVPSLAFQAIAFGVLLRNKPSLAYFAAPMLVVLSLLPFKDQYLVPHSVRAAFHFRLNRTNFVDEHDHWRFMRTNAERWRKKGELIKQFTNPDESLVEGAIGHVGFFSGLTIFDRMGLVTRIPKQASPKKLRSPGHDIRVPELFFLDREPTYLYAKYTSLDRIKGIARTRKKYPYPYAPVLFEEPLRGKKPQMPMYLVLMKRHGSKEAYEAAWQDVNMPFELREKLLKELQRKRGSQQN